MKNYTTFVRMRSGKDSKVNFFADFDADFLYTSRTTQEKAFLKILKKNSQVWPSYKLSKFDGQAIFCPIQCTVRDPRPWHKLSETASLATYRAAYIGPPAIDQRSISKRSRVLDTSLWQFYFLFLFFILHSSRKNRASLDWWSLAMIDEASVGQRSAAQG